MKKIFTSSLVLLIGIPFMAFSMEDNPEPPNDQTELPFDPSIIPPCPHGGTFTNFARMEQIDLAGERDGDPRHKAMIECARQFEAQIYQSTLFTGGPAFYVDNDNPEIRCLDIRSQNTINYKAQTQHDSIDITKLAKLLLELTEISLGELGSNHQIDLHIQGKAKHPPTAVFFKLVTIMLKKIKEKPQLNVTINLIFDRVWDPCEAICESFATGSEVFDTIIFTFPQWEKAMCADFANEDTPVYQTVKNFFPTSRIEAKADLSTAIFC